MHDQSPHNFHIPVMGLGFTIDTPAKVAKYGISSVMSIAEDNMIEQMREIHSSRVNVPFEPIKESDPDHRAKRITSYLNLISEIIDAQVERMKKEDFNGSNDIDRYFQFLPESNPLKKDYERLFSSSDEEEKKKLIRKLKDSIIPGSADVNIMTKCDRANEPVEGEEHQYKYNDAAAALRGFALSKRNSSIVFSAGLNPRLFSYCETFNDFYPDQSGKLKKKIIIKVSDYRSAEIQGKFLAKKGLWVSEFRIESGLNCGGHAFPTDGLLLGPILEAFRKQKETLRIELFTIVNNSLQTKGRIQFSEMPEIKVTVQGGIGTSAEHQFLLDVYKVDSTGWGSPFLMVPEATNLDDESLKSLCNSKPGDFYLSYASPLGVGFNNFRNSSSERQRRKRIEAGRPGSPCYKKFLAFNTEFTSESICTASRKYQYLKLKQIDHLQIPEEQKNIEREKVMEKDCLCEGLSVPALTKNNYPHPKKLTAVTLCPGPNLANFTSIFTLKEMVDHIYGRVNLLNNNSRPHMFISELKMYVQHYFQQLKNGEKELTESAKRNIQTYRANVMEGIEHYKNILKDSLSELQAIQDELMMESQLVTA